MTIDHSTCLWLVQEPTHTYHTDNLSLTSKRAAVLTAGYPPLKSNNGAGTWRKILRINGLSRLALKLERLMALRSLTGN